MRPDDLEGFVKLTEHAPLPITSCEVFTRRQQFDEWIERRAVDYIQVIPTPSHHLGCISLIPPPFFLVFCAFSPPRRDGSNEPQARTQGQETAGTGVQAVGNTVSPG